MGVLLSPEAHAARLARIQVQRENELEWFSVVAACKAGVWGDNPPWQRDDFYDAKYAGFDRVNDGWNFAAWVLSR